jgi:Protein of unknown function (DUF3147)
MTQILIRFLAGGAIVTLFALMGDLLKPKSFAGLFGAAPSVALATLSLTIATEGARYASIEARSMIAGAVAFLVYATCCSWSLMRLPYRALLVTVCAMPLWFATAFGIWGLFLK